MRKITPEQLSRKLLNNEYETRDTISLRVLNGKIQSGYKDVYHKAMSVWNTEDKIRQSVKNVNNLYFNDEKPQFYSYLAKVDKFMTTLHKGTIDSLKTGNDKFNNDKLISRYNKCVDASEKILQSFPTEKAYRTLNDMNTFMGKEIPIPINIKDLSAYKHLDKKYPAMEDYLDDELYFKQDPNPVIDYLKQDVNYTSDNMEYSLALHAKYDLKDNRQNNSQTE